MSIPNIDYKLFGVAFLLMSPRHTCVLIIPFNQHPDMAHLSGGLIILAKEKCALPQI